MRFLQSLGAGRHFWQSAWPHVIVVIVIIASVIVVVIVMFVVIVIFVVFIVVCLHGLMHGQ